MDAMENSANEDQVFQYYRLIDQDADTQEMNFQTVYFVKEDEDNTTPNFNCESDTTTETNTLTSCGPNVQIITIENGKMIMTTSEDALTDENYDAVEPHLITTDCCEEDKELKEEELLSDKTLSDNDFKIVQLVSDDSEMYEMVYVESQESPQSVAEKEDSYVCLYENCRKIFTAPHHLNVHMRKHQGHKSYACTEEGCDKFFSKNYSLKAHIRTHTGEKPFGCQICSKCFKTSGDLQKHMRVHTGEKPFMCPFEGCGKSFTTSNIRKIHVRSHTGERPFACKFPDCGKAFSSSTNFKNHIRIHTGEKPFQCAVEGCGKRFTEYSSLHKHSIVHQSERPYACSQCGQKFKQESAIALHKKLKHNMIVCKDGTELVVCLS